MRLNIFSDSSSTIEALKDMLMQFLKSTTAPNCTHLELDLRNFQRNSLDKDKLLEMLTALRDEYRKVKLDVTTNTAYADEWDAAVLSFVNLQEHNAKAKGIQEMLQQEVATLGFDRSGGGTLSVGLLGSTTDHRVSKHQWQAASGYVRSIIEHSDTFTDGTCIRIDPVHVPGASEKLLDTIVRWVRLVYGNPLVRQDDDTNWDALMYVRFLDGPGTMWDKIRNLVVMADFLQMDRLLSDIGWYIAEYVARKRFPGESLEENARNIREDMAGLFATTPLVRNKEIELDDDWLQTA